MEPKQLIVMDHKSQRIASSSPRQIKLTYAATNTGTGHRLSFNDELYVGYLKEEYASRHYLTVPISVAIVEIACKKAQFWHRTVQ